MSSPSKAENIDLSTEKVIQHSQQIITVATLNYGGIINNPFQFYSEDSRQDFQDISKIYMQTLPLYFSDYQQHTFSWNLGKIDKKIRLGRYSPYFGLQAGIQNGAFINKQNFDAKWDKSFEQLAHKFKVDYSQEQKSLTRVFDFLIFHVLLKYIYKQESFEDLITKDPQPYIKKFEPLYKLSFLDQTQKLKIFQQNFRYIDADVLFFQEYSPALEHFIGNQNDFYYEVGNQRDGLIAINKSKFKNIKKKQQVLTQQQLQKINFGNRSPIIVVDEFIIIGIHLSSKTAQNQKQIQELQDGLIYLRKALPEYHIIAAGDLNSFLGPIKPFSTQFNMYPIDKNKATTVKMRTMTQAQFNKGNKLVVQSKDKVISTLKLIGGNCNYINGQVANKNSLLPCNSHPFDHFMVFGVFKRFS